MKRESCIIVRQAAVFTGNSKEHKSKYAARYARGNQVSLQDAEVGAQNRASQHQNAQ